MIIFTVWIKSDELEMRYHVKEENRRDRKVHISEFACMHWDEAAGMYGSGEEGLSEARADENRKKYGVNRASSGRGDTVSGCIRRAFVNPFTVVLFVTGMFYAVTDVFLKNAFSGNRTAAAVIFVMLITGCAVRLTQELGARKAADALNDLVDTQIRVKRDGKWKYLHPYDIVCGDVIALSAGDRCPADLRLISEDSLFVSQAVITGESGVRRKHAQALSKKPEKTDDYTDILFAGTTVAGGECVAVAVAVGKDTLYGELSMYSEEERHGFDRGADSIAMVLVRFMAVSVPVVFAVSGIVKGMWLQSFMFALSAAVGITPELLPMVVNACLAKGSRSMGRKKTVVKNINAMQSFGSMDVLCVDKTGTLTGEKVLLEYYMDVLGNESRKTLDYGYIAAYYHSGVSNHIDSAIKSTEDMPGRREKCIALIRDYVKTGEKPFDYGCGYSSVTVEHDGEEIEIIKGSVDSVVSVCGSVEYRGSVIGAGEDPVSEAHKVADEMLEDGMKVIAVAWRKGEGDFVLLGFLAFFDAPKKSAATAVSELLEADVKVKLLTGDSVKAACAVCRRLGIPSETWMTGREFESLDDNSRNIAVQRTDVFAELTPSAKAGIVQCLKENGHTVGFLGDGLNDLPAMTASDVAISVENAAEAARETADVILMKKDLNVLREGVIEGRRVFANMQKYIRITASSNFGNVLAIAVAGVLLPFFPMTSVQLLLLNLLYDILCLILPWDNVDREMLEKPLEWSGRTLGRFMRFFGPLSSLFDIVTFAFLYFILCPYVCGGNFTALDMAGQARFIAIFQTGWFLESMWSQVMILHLLRTEKIPFVQSRPNRLVLLVTAAGTVLFSALPLTAAGRAIGLSEMPAVYYLFLAVTVAAYLFTVTAAKSVYVRKYGRML